VLHGSYSYLLQDRHGQVANTHTISAGLDYPGVGPEHSYLYQSGRVEYTTATDTEALMAFRELSLLEGIIPALETSFALAAAKKLARRMSHKQILIINLSGRGDKDLQSAQEALSHLSLRKRNSRCQLLVNVVRS